MLSIKKITIVCLLILLHQFCGAQFLKKLGQKAKEEVEYRAQRKAGQKIDQGLDTILAAPKKIVDKKKAKDANTNTTLPQGKQNAAADSQKNEQAGDPKNTIAVSANNSDDLTPKDGYITLALSADKVFTGGSISLTGESINYKKYTQVEITVSGPSAKDVQSVSLDANGKYTAVWNAGDKTGVYTVIVKSSDKKAQQSTRLTVYSLPQMSNWANENIDAANKAYDKLKEDVAKVDDNLSAKNKSELDKKLGEVKDKVDDVLKLLKDLNTAGKETAALAKKTKTLPPNISANLSELNNNLADNARQLKNFTRITPPHEASDNTICEYLVIASEACAAFSAFTNIWSRSLATIAKNIMLDKAVPTTVSTMINSRIPSEGEFAAKETSKIFATALFDAESLTTKLGQAGIAGDFIQFTSDILLKTYCGVFKGDFKHDYTVTFRNDKGETWWKYGVTMESTVSLRYPKDKSHGNVIQMKGNLEGNATNFTFFADVAKEDGFHEGSKGKIEVIPLHVYMPAALPFATSKKDVAGFGAVARGAATPAYFNIPVDAEYDVDANTIKLFVNAPIVDFTDLVCTQFLFLEVGGDLLPYIKKMNFPIHKASATIGSIIRSNNEIAVDKDSKGNLSFYKKANKHLGSKTDKIEHDLNFTITAKKE